jgi:hypothetical protein
MDALLGAGFNESNWRVHSMGWDPVAMTVGCNGAAGSGGSAHNTPAGSGGSGGSGGGGGRAKQAARSANTNCQVGAGERELAADAAQCAL